MNEQKGLKKGIIVLKMIKNLTLNGLKKGDIKAKVNFLGWNFEKDE
jgi:hypothetical protein